MSSALFSPLGLRSVTTRNRIMVSPMCQYSAPNGVPNEWHFVHLGSRAVGGAGIVMSEATAICPAGRITPYDVGLWNDQQEFAFARIAEFVAAQGAVPGIQLAHAGRKASHARPWEGRIPLKEGEGGWQVVGPGSQPWEPGDVAPRALDADGIADVLEAFRNSAQRALRAGFRIVEIHAAHGYLLHSFLSPLSNFRDDGYGGSLENRARLLLECIAAVRSVWPKELPVFVRISASDWVAGGWTIDDSIELACLLQSKAVDLIDCSSGGASPAQQVPAKPHYQVGFSSRIRREAAIATGAVGLIGEAIAAEAIITGGNADLVVMGRRILWDPYWPIHAAKELGARPPLPMQYARADI
jgi:2,4-dienoyl-CoA reductase-like NADH-dependent reductase (Old Yellow Enzyme family)